MTRLKPALARDYLRGLTATKVISWATFAFAVATEFVVPGSVVVSVVALSAMVMAYITSRLLQEAEHQGATTVCAYVRYRCTTTWQKTKSTAKRLFTLAAPDGWKKDPNTVDDDDNVTFIPTKIRIAVVIFIAIFAAEFILAFVGFAGLDDSMISVMFSVAISYSMLTISCLLTASAFIFIVILFFLQHIQIEFLQSRLGFCSSVRRIPTWIGYAGAVGAVMASLVPFVVSVVPALTRSAKRGAVLNAITPRWMLDFPAAGAVAGYAVGLIVAMASLFPESKNSWLRRLVCPGLFVVVFVALSHNLGGPRGLLQPVIDDAALRSGFNDTFCTSAAPTDIDSGSLDARAWAITKMDRCEGGFLISTTAIGWIVGIAALLVGVSLFINDIRVRARSKECRSDDSSPVCPAPPQR